MLQQTQIATVIPYYQRLLRAFPTVAKLARAPLDRVLALWSGMGYYRRARNLHRAARMLVRRHSGRFPRDYGQARALPGVGDYTARAVLSIAYKQPYAVMDGNVARVAARLKARRGNVHVPAFRKAVQTELQRLLSRRQPGKFNQAIMELGQTICLPRGPRCLACPLRRWCRAYRLSKPEDYPSPRPRRSAEPHYLAAAILRRGSGVAMVRGLDEGLLGELWNFPSAFGKSAAEARRRLQKKLNALASRPVRLGPRLANLQHGITYRSIRVQVYQAELGGKFIGESVRWVRLDRLAQTAVSQLVRKISAQLGRRDFKPLPAPPVG